MFAATLAMLLVIAKQLAAPLVAGSLASWFFDLVRKAFPVTDPPRLGRATHVVMALLHAPRWSRLTVLWLAWLIGTNAQICVALLTGGDPFAPLDGASAGLLAFIYSQFIHARRLSGDVSVPLPLTDPDGPIYLGEDQPRRRRGRYAGSVRSNEFWPRLDSPALNPQIPTGVDIDPARIHYSSSLFGTNLTLSEPPTWYANVPAEDRLPPVGAGVGRTPSGEPLTAQADPAPKT
jgi:hypothetical protein